MAISNQYVAVSFCFSTMVDSLRHRANDLYGGEAVTQLEHALQCAALAMTAGATSSLVSAALLHDLGHLADRVQDAFCPHENLAAQLLDRLFEPAVTEPIRMHVDAKRYLCAIDAAYWSGLSPASKDSLVWQGGPYTAPEAAQFIAQPYAGDAVKLRRWDDAAKIEGKHTPPLDAFIGVMQSVLKPAIDRKAA
jgi:phosphonate degradation associated HDIG domain protein